MKHEFIRSTGRHNGAAAWEDRKTALGELYWWDKTQHVGSGGRRNHVSDDWIDSQFSFRVCWGVLCR